MMGHHTVKFEHRPAAARWARENGCGWDIGTCRAAVFGGRLDVLKVRAAAQTAFHLW